VQISPCLAGVNIASLALPPTHFLLQKTVPALERAIWTQGGDTHCFKGPPLGRPFPSLCFLSSVLESQLTLLSGFFGGNIIITISPHFGMKAILPLTDFLPFL
jgi:hypothetical protein